MDEQTPAAQPTTSDNLAPQYSVSPWAVGVPLSLISAVIATGLTNKLGVAAFALPILAAVALGWVLHREQSWFALSHEGTVGVLIGVAILSLLGAGAARQAKEQREERTRAVEQIVALGRADPAAQKARLAALDEETLATLKDVAPDLEAAERARRSAEAGRLAQEAARRLELANHDKIAEVLAREKSMPPSDYESRAAAYRVLHELAPGREDFSRTLAELTEKQQRQAGAREHPEQSLVIVRTMPAKSGFGSVMILNADIRNTSDLVLKDFTVTCNHTAPSGTQIDSNTRIVYERIMPGQTKRLRDINMGFIASQVVATQCEITDAKIGY